MANDGDDEGSADKGIVPVSLAPSITALLQPTAKLLGTRLRDHVRDKLDDWDRKRKAGNLEKHLNRNLKNLETAARSNSLSDEELKTIPQWIDAVENVDPTDLSLTEAWDNILAQILNGNKSASDLLLALRSLTPEEAQQLLRLRGRTFKLPSSGFQDGILQRLAAKGVVRAQSVWLAYIGLGAVTIAVLEVFRRFKVPSALVSDGTLLGVTSTQSWFTYSLAFLLFFFLSIIVGYYFAPYTYRVYFVTPLGKDLLSKAPLSEKQT